MVDDIPRLSFFKNVYLGIFLILFLLFMLLLGMNKRIAYISGRLDGMIEIQKVGNWSLELKLIHIAISLGVLVAMVLFVLIDLIGIEHKIDRLVDKIDRLIDRFR